jgi:hypothetical protein
MTIAIYTETEGKEFRRSATVAEVEAHTVRVLGNTYTQVWFRAKEEKQPVLGLLTLTPEGARRLATSLLAVSDSIVPKCSFDINEDLQ